MATTGKAAWEKYFKGKGDVSTTVKKNTEAFDVTNVTKAIGTIAAGTKVTVKSVTAYNAKALIEYKAAGRTVKARVKFDELQKPGIVSKVNPDNVKTLANKSLSPDGLQLAGKKINKSSYLTTVKAAIDKHPSAPATVKKFLKEFLDKSIKADNNLSPLVKEISDKDLKIIAKDFGEVAGAWWFINNYDKTLSYIEFPIKANEPLVDYYVGYSTGLTVKVSAKADKGAAPSLTSIWKVIEKKKFTGAEKDVWEFIKVIAENDGLESIIEASKHYNSTAYNNVKTMIGWKSAKTFTSEDLEMWIDKHKDGKELHSILDKKLYSKINRTVEQSKVLELMTAKRKSGLILSPMAYSLMDEVNKDKKYTGFLTKICRTLGVEQLYVSIKQNTAGLKYNLKGFKDNDFEFEYHSNSANPGGNKIGFFMKH
jgi:hypothetical protein